MHRHQAALIALAVADPQSGPLTVQGEVCHFQGQGFTDPQACPPLETHYQGGLNIGRTLDKCLDFLRL
jgi:hypothetical protein